MRKKIHPVIEECFRLHDVTDQDEKHRGWLALWHEHMEGDKIHTTDIGDAGGITFLGCDIAMQAGRFEEAIRYCQVFFSHRDVERADMTANLALRSTLFGCLLKVGQEAQATEIGELLMSLDRPADRRKALLLLRVALLETFQTMSLEVEASQRLTDFVWTIAVQYKRRTVRRQLPERATYGELADVLIMTFPPKYRDRRLAPSTVASDTLSL